MEIGGTLIFDPVVARLRGGEDLASAGVLTLYHRYLDRLFTAGSGTSYAAPRVAFSAAQILTRFPQASANLVRALIISSAETPQPAQERLRLLGADATHAICGHGLVDLERAAFSDDARITLYAEDELALDHFAVYRIPIPEPFRAANGERCIRVTLAFDPPVRHSRNDYAGVGMSFRLIRGCRPDLIFDHYRKRDQDDGPFPELAPRYNCNLVPGAQAREKGTVQCATVAFKRSVEDYGDSYYLVVRCESGWARHVDRQQFSIVVELLHKADVQLYERCVSDFAYRPNTLAQCLKRSGGPSLDFRHADWSYHFFCHAAPSSTVRPPPIRTPKGPGTQLRACGRATRNCQGTRPRSIEAAI